MLDLLSAHRALEDAAEVASAGGEISPYLRNAPRTLREACHAAGRDGGGWLCRGCCVREFCERQSRRAQPAGG